MYRNKLIANRIKRLRQERNYTAEFVARELHISTGAYSNLENGKVEVSLRRIYDLSQVLEFPVALFIQSIQNKRQGIKQPTTHSLLLENSQVLGELKEMMETLKLTSIQKN